jgi:hypothetical protein
MVASWIFLVLIFLQIASSTGTTLSSKCIIRRKQYLNGDIDANMLATPKLKGGTAFPVEPIAIV